MSKGLKQMVAEATDTTEQAVQPKPVDISGEALRALSIKAREWSGWPNATVKIGKPDVSPFASCDHTTRTFTVNVDALVLNPHRVLHTITPFRLRQEAVLTGTMLHEAGHARFSHWLPRTVEEAKAKPLRHSNGDPVSKATVSLARLMEEPRVEGLIAAMSGRIGAAGLDWTMRASAAHLLPGTRLAMDPNQQVMDLIKSWALRAGRQYALQYWTGFEVRNWAGDFTALLQKALVTHLESDETPGVSKAAQVIRLLQDMIQCDDHMGTSMIDQARDILTILFPETPPEEQPETGDGCTGGESQPSQDEGEDSEPEDQPEDQSGDTEGEPESDEQDSDEGETQPEDAEPGDEPAEDEAGESDDTDENSELAEALAEMEGRATSETEDEADEEIDADPASGAGAGGDGSEGGEWRSPSRDEREIAKSAERFLRDLIAPSESAQIVLTESPSATVDPGAMAAWKAGGMVRDPLFFKRTRRNVQPSPPVKVAILVDVSGSMDSLQKPSAILSWALASAALDLRNFAGRGQQVESCLIHWGSTARVIQRNGEVLPGIREFECYEGTAALSDAMDLVEEQMPGFLTESEHPENRLLVNFTDWELSSMGRRAAFEKIRTALAVGVNMLSVVPREYSERYSDLPEILRGRGIQRGTSTLLKYNQNTPSQVWDEAAKTMLVGAGQ